MASWRNGRRDGFKIRFLRESRFKSGRGYKIVTRMKIVFLDIDGVLNTGGFRHTFGGDRIDPFLVQNLAYILFKTGCKIVVSSTWKFNMNDVFLALQCDAFDNRPPQGMIDRITGSIIDSTFDLDTREEENPWLGRIPTRR